MALAPEQQQHNQDARAWARENGWPDLSDAGRLPAAVHAAYEAFQSAAAGQDDGSPDFSAAMKAMGLELGTSPLDTDDDDGAQPDPDPDGGGQAPPPPQIQLTDGSGRIVEQQQPADQGLPPVADLDQARQRVAASRAAPSWADRPPGGGKGGSGGTASASGQGKGRRRGTPRPPQPPPGPAPIDITPQLLNEMSGKLGMLLLGPVKMWEKLDPVCGGAAKDSGPEIIDAWLPLLARSQAVVRLLSIDALWMQLFTAVTVTWPLLETIHDHHFSEQARQRKTGEARAAAEQQAAEDLDLYPSAPPVSGHTPAYRQPTARM